MPLLVDRDIHLSVSQVHRLATGTPERLSLPVLAALCDIFNCTPADLIATKAQNAAVRKTATDDGVVNLNRMRNPRAGVNWISRPHVHTMLRALADPSLPVTHETLDSMTPWRSVAYLRDLLMLHGVLPHVDRHLMLFQRWLRDTLDGIGEREPRQLVERFATWHVLHRLRRFADRGPVTEKQTQQARAEIRQAIAFLAWLRERGLLLAACRQAEVDAWYAGAYTARRLTHAFLRWAMRNKLLVRVTIPHQDTRNPTSLSQHDRIALIRRLVTDEDIPLLARVLRLTVDEVLHENGEVSIRLGEPPTPVPEPFAGLLQQHIQQRLNLTTATNLDASWLFPGRRGGQPMTADTVERRLRRHGIRTLTGRTAALRQLVLEAPAPVVARMLGYTLDNPARLATEDRGEPGPLRPDDHSR